MNIAPNSQSANLLCEVNTEKAKNYKIRYSWYESPDGSTDTGTAIAGASSPVFTTPVFTEKEIHYYYCKVSDGNNKENPVLISNAASVAHTALPTLYIETPDGADIASKDEWLANTIVSLAGASNKTWNFEGVSASIRGRGNTAWELPKKTYALKFDIKQEITGFPEHRRWILLANYTDNSFIRNDSAFYLSEIFEMDWTPRGNFVDLVLNGEYKGLYWLGEDIRVHKDRVSINDGDDDIEDSKDKDYLIEMDKSYDEPVKFRSPIRDLPYMIKNEDYMTEGNGTLSSGGEARLGRLQEKIGKLESLLYPDCRKGDDTNDCPAPYESYLGTVDADSWIKFWFVNEIMENTELNSPESAYFTFSSARDIFKAGPVWDFDRALLAKPSGCILKEAVYYNALFKSPLFRKRVRELWNEYYGEINIKSHIELMRGRLAIAAEYDKMLWGVHNDPSGVQRENFDAYVDFLKEGILDKISIVDKEISEME